MKRYIWKLFVFLCGPALLAQTNVPVRLAIVPENSEAAAVADVLTAELSKDDRVQLLERAAVEKVCREQRLSAANRDDLKLGQILGADGLVLLEPVQSGSNQFLSVELVAVKPGVLLSGERFNWPLEKMTQWASDLARHYDPLFPKLGVLAKEAIPVSVLNLRSAIQSSESRAAERQLTLLAIERLSREKRLFVLERRKMQFMSSEKELKGLDDSAFWDGSYLLDGTLDNDGYSQDTITINARLIPPNGGAPIAIAVSGSRTNYTVVINRLAKQVLGCLNVSTNSGLFWNAADEAEQFYTEAQWAMKWGLYSQAQAAAESAWALGKRTSEAARLLVHAYAETLPELGMNTTDLPVYQVPDAREFAPLDRGLEFFTMNAPVLFAETNSPVSFNLGLRLLRPALGQLESYYYAAEQRADHADELLALRDKVRRLFILLDAHPPVVTNRWIGSWQDPRVLYPQLKWDEGGTAFERPEDAVKFYEGMLATRALPEELPRIIGWTWPDRQRVPALMARFIADTRASTNVAVRMEGLYFALLLAPDDEAGSLRRAEEELESAMWDNREVIFQNANTAALVERTRSALIKKLGGDNIYRAYDHEPFASFKHRFRMAFLSSEAGTNLDVLEELFPNTNVKMETPEQARELLPLMEGLARRLPANRISNKLAPLGSGAGVVAPSVAPLPALQPAAVLEATFVPWNVTQEAERIPRFSGMIWRAGQLWVRVRYCEKNRSDYGQNVPTAYLAAEPRRGVVEEIVFPEDLGQPGSLFEVSSNALFVEASGHLFEYSFREKNWTEISVPMDGATGMAWLNNRLFIGRSDGLLAVEQESKKVTVLVSARRTPAANVVDPLWTSRTRIFPQADGRLGVLAAENFLAFDPVADRWDIRPLPLTGTNLYFNMFAEYFSASGAQRLLTGPFARRYLLGFWNDGPAESLLMEESGITQNAPAAEKLLPPLRWDWPKKFPMEQSQIVTEGKTLWALAPRQWEFGATGPKTVEFSDNRDATLLRFTPGSRSPMSVGVHLPMDSLPNRPMVNGRPTGVLDSSNFGYMGGIFQRFDQRVGNMAFWLRVPGGLVFGGPSYCGHWFIADTDLKEMLKPVAADQPKPMQP